jgi:stage II sporulation protein D
MRRISAQLVLIASLLAPFACAQSVVRVGVLGLFHPRELELDPSGSQPLWIDGTCESFLLNGEPGHRRLLLHASGDRVQIRGISASRIQVAARDGRPLGFQLSVPGKLHRIYEGTLTITAMRNELIAVVTMDRENAVATIVASEMPPNAPVEALKAQAVVSRSFLNAGPRHHGFDFCDTTHCQFLRSPEEANARVQAAVQSTRGMVLSWHDHPIAALYSSRCGGQTRTLQDAGMEPGNGYPYYEVPCPWCRRHPFHWQSRVPAGAEMPNPGNESSRIAHARLWGWSALPGARYTVESDSDGVLLRGKDMGNGLGLCQFGAIGMAATGADYRAILAHYYPNSEFTQLP